ncbi:hypothetical protein PM082_021766 [Marasmius tenuissimus]|nr:hypothetical protein PM082_021766 [Marasmius tenuissimus]
MFSAELTTGAHGRTPLRVLPVATPSNHSSNLLGSSIILIPNIPLTCKPSFAKALRPYCRNVQDQALLGPAKVASDHRAAYATVLSR